MSVSKEYPRPSPTTEISIQFEQQLDHVARWLTFWTHELCVGFLQKLLRICTLDEMNFLWSVSEPALHRDFLYSSSLDHPYHGFMPISTHRSRQIRRRLEERRLRSKGNEKTIHRMQSAMLRSMTDIKQLCQSNNAPEGLKKESVLPTIYANPGRDYLFKDHHRRISIMKGRECVPLQLLIYSRSNIVPCCAEPDNSSTYIGIQVTVTSLPLT
ncbi:uncharacterized protein TRIADDRAFT_61796 [Trichoplax adhaerens]|uniref:Uncharacterized protein n=1 Tax=Trichoplax adhaerens TaxID=10228 RepID=B3SBZ8_TRIAD|nr:hypothetical protein TRIADDRAFT_61796 [Trichoplax adhaerens]EDV19762.1 hypothetical protein TRIADDRAFT_61796 [Trichoplax adhaerens]|eukprot:XP_002117786.1 hypothetical protein TRIADDRAFT_61796 [Trichoplax adhaerens]